MTAIIPKNTILQQNGNSDMLGDIIESFNIDLTSNYGSIKTTGMKEVINSSDSTDIGVPVAFAFFNNNYYFVTDDYVYKGGANLDDTFTKETTGGAPTNEMSEAFSDLALFNGYLYASGVDEVFKKSTGGTWTEPLTSGTLEDSPHLMTPFGDRLYITNDYTIVTSINTGDALATTVNRLDLGLNSEEWSITMLKAASDKLWVGLVNTVNSKGLMYTWDGATTNTPTSRYELDSGVVAGEILNNTPYFLDVNGRLMVFNGSGFSETASLYKKTPYIFQSANEENNLRFIHPNGITVTDSGTILMLISNETDSQSGDTYEDTIPSGVYEYDPNIGLYHKYSLSYSPVGGTSVTNYGQQRIKGDGVGALLFSRPQTPTTTNNGILIGGAEYYTDATTTQYGVFCDDTFDTTQKWGYFITSKIFSSSIEDTWKKAYIVYEDLLNVTDKIIVKYRTKNDIATESTITWVDTSSFTTTTDVSSYVAGDEVQVVQGTGSGKSAHISSITESGGTYTVVLDDTFTGVTGTAIVLFSKWIKAGTITDANPKKWQALTFPTGNTSPYIQIKVCMQFTGKNEVYKMRVISNSNVNE